MPSERPLDSEEMAAFVDRLSRQTTALEQVIVDLQSSRKGPIGAGDAIDDVVAELRVIERDLRRGPPAERGDG